MDREVFETKNNTIFADIRRPSLKPTARKNRVRFKSAPNSEFGAISNGPSSLDLDFILGGKRFPVVYPMRSPEQTEFLDRSHVYV